MVFDCIIFSKLHIDGHVSNISNIMDITRYPSKVACRPMTLTITMTITPRSTGASVSVRADAECEEDAGGERRRAGREVPGRAAPRDPPWVVGARRRARPPSQSTRVRRRGRAGPALTAELVAAALEAATALAASAAAVVARRRPRFPSRSPTAPRTTTSTSTSTKTRRRKLPFRKMYVTYNPIHLFIYSKAPLAHLKLVSTNI